MASSGKATRSALAWRASLIHVWIKRVLPTISPTVGLIWAMAIRSDRISKACKPSAFSNQPEHESSEL
jgi:hypothetical protein